MKNRFKKSNKLIKDNLGEHRYLFLEKSKHGERWNNTLAISGNVSINQRKTSVYLGDKKSMNDVKKEFFKNIKKDKSIK